MLKSGPYPFQNTTTPTCTYILLIHKLRAFYAKYDNSGPVIIIHPAKCVRLVRYWLHGLIFLSYFWQYLQVGTLIQKIKGSDEYNLFFLNKNDILIIYWLLRLIFHLITCSLNCRYNLHITDVGYHPHRAMMGGGKKEAFFKTSLSQGQVTDWDGFVFHACVWIFSSNYPMGLMHPMVSLVKPLIQPHKRWPLTPPHISRSIYPPSRCGW